MPQLETAVLAIGAGGAGMYAAVAAARAGARVVLVDKSLVGRGGATIRAQMTVAAAVAVVLTPLETTFRVLGAVP